MARVRVALAALSLLLVKLAGAQTAVPTLKANTRIVVVDVVVTDRQGNAVKNLQASDFALAENGAPQLIEHFEAHTSLSAEGAARLPPMPKLDANIFTNYSLVPANGPLNVMLFDAMNTKMIDQSVVLQQMQKFLAKPHPGVRMDLFEFNSDLKLLHGFTSDQEALIATLASRKSSPQASMMTYNPNANGWGIEHTDGHDLFKNMPDSTESLQIGIPDPAAIDANGTSTPEKTGAEQAMAFKMQDRQLSTLQALNALAKYLGAFPGRKNLLWFSSSFPIAWDDRGIADKLHDTMALLAKNQVAVYPIDARGLREHCGGLLTPCPIETMQMMAGDTGGKVFAGSNDLADAVTKAVDDGSNYYTLAYTPANRDWKGEFRKVEVKLAQKGFTLAYRPGYYAENVARKIDAKVDAPATVSPARAALQVGMQFGAPQPTEIVFKVAANPATGKPEETVAPVNQLAPKVTGPFERYLLSVAALPEAFTFVRNSPGKIHMSAKLVTCVYSADGALLDLATLNVSGNITDESYKAMLRNGVKFEQEVSVPIKGETYLRIGVEDLASARMGVVEIPVAMLAKLKPIEAK